MGIECYNPVALSRDAISEWTGVAKSPGGLRWNPLKMYSASLFSGIDALVYSSMSQYAIPNAVQDKSITN
jgi:hypothetical protein